MLWDSGILDGVFVCVLFHNTADVLALSCRYNRTLSLNKGSLIIHTQFSTSHVGDVENAKIMISNLSLSCFSVCSFSFCHLVNVCGLAGWLSVANSSKMLVFFITS